jgi:hypothetical protein
MSESTRTEAVSHGFVLAEAQITRSNGHHSIRFHVV